MKLSPNQIQTQLEHIDGWRFDETKNAISKRFEFATFREAIRFVNHVAQLAEKADHHPNIDIRPNQVMLFFTTHSAKGLTSKDFDLAHQINGFIS